MGAYVNTAPARDRRVTGKDTLLRGALKLDAAVTGANGVAYLALAGVLDELLGVPSGALRAIGAFLLVFAAAVAFVGTRGAVSRVAAGIVVAANVLWVLDSVVVAGSGAWSPSTAGTVWIGLQAAVVALFAGLQVVGLRRAG